MFDNYFIPLKVAFYKEDNLFRKIIAKIKIKIKVNKILQKI